VIHKRRFVAAIWSNGQQTETDHEQVCLLPQPDWILKELNSRLSPGRASSLYFAPNRD
jgi:hypothetical protein